METNKQLAHTLQWLVNNHHVPGFMPKQVMTAATRLVEQGERIAELEAILSAKTHAASVEIVPDGPYSKDVRMRIDVVDPRPFYASQLVQDYQLFSAPPDYLDHLARASLRMACRQFEGVMFPQATTSLHEAVKRLRNAETAATPE